jgi:hypothetical protein
VKKSRTIQLIAFKPSGKYYSHYEVTADIETFQSGPLTLMATFSICDAVTSAIDLGQIPRGFVYTLDMLKHPDEVPALFPIE